MQFDLLTKFMKCSVPLSFNFESEFFFAELSLNKSSKIFTVSEKNGFFLRYIVQIEMVSGFWGVHTFTSSLFSWRNTGVKQLLSMRNLNKCRNLFILL